MKCRKFMTKVSRLVIILAVTVTTVLAQDGILELKHVNRKQITYAGFSLDSDKSVKIEAVGAGGEERIKRKHENWIDEHNLFAYAWIINSDTREMVWRMTVQNTDKEKWSEYNRRFEGEVNLEEGEYEIYFASVDPLYLIIDEGFFSVEKLVKKILGEDMEWEEKAEDWRVKISGVDQVFNANDVRKYHSVLKEDAIVQLTNVSDDFDDQIGFTLEEPAKVDIYGIGEGWQGKMYDYGWIVNASNRETVWEMRERDSEPAGGAVKNRQFRETIKLDAGDYLVYYQTDDSHSPEAWNANPPYDPFFWGIMLKPSSKNFDRSIVKKYSEKALISINRVGDYAYKEEAFEVTKSSKIRVYSLGEGRRDEMFDYGWITDANTGRIVWKMKYRQTKHAGGASKNRLYDNIITLDPGKYIVHYQSDDSHSYEDWNARKPQHHEMWGITLYPLGKEETLRRLEKDIVRGTNIIAQLVRIGDDEHMKKQFYLDKSTRIRVYCLGEGDDDEMYDYGYIRNAKTHHTVWRMTYRNTMHAGGAQKNRLVDTIITLSPGTYFVHYKSDGSHSYYDWNASPPHDRHNWGITLYKVDETN